MPLPRFLFPALILFLISSCSHQDHLFSGYVDTDLLYLSADFGGRLTDLAVMKGETVKKEQFLFKLEQRSEQYHIKMSQLNHKELLAQRQQILVQHHYNEINYRRTLSIRKQNAASQNDVDTARRNLNNSKQQLADIDAKIQSNLLDTADKQWQLGRKESFAPDDGIVFDTYHTKGEFVTAGAPVLSLITPGSIKAVFFVPEIRLSQLRLNQSITLKTDANERFATGHIAYISKTAEYTPPIIYSREERQQLVFRVEAHIDSPDLEKIHLGQPVTLELAR